MTHFRALPWQEMNIFMTQLHQQEGIASKALELLILTACRSGEVRLTTWEEFDLEQKTDYPCSSNEGE